MPVDITSRLYTPSTNSSFVSRIAEIHLLAFSQSFTLTDSLSFFSNMICKILLSPDLNILNFTIKYPSESRVLATSPYTLCSICVLQTFPTANKVIIFF